jgi:glycine cleavage system regulatory protein
MPVRSFAVSTSTKSESVDEVVALSGATFSILHLNSGIEDKATTSSTDSDFVLVLTANDRTGIIQEISSIIHQQGGNLIKLVSQQSSAPHTGHELFKAKATISVDENTIESLICALEDLADDLMVKMSRNTDQLQILLLVETTSNKTLLFPGVITNQLLRNL